jgi:hypothetical protein
MTETEWLACEDSEPMLKFLQKRGLNRDRGGRRRLRLVGCACTRRVGHYLTGRGQRWVDLGEQIADNLLKFQDRKRVESEDLGVSDGQRVDHYADGAAWFTLASNVMIAAEAAAMDGAGAVEMATWHKNKNDKAADRARAGERQAQAVLIRDIFGNPFRPVTFSPEWRTSTAVALASQMYESRDFGAMPILADALQDAGCDNDEVLGHCRGPGPHVRGCWVVDLVLGME